MGAQKEDIRRVKEKEKEKLVTRSKQGGQYKAGTAVIVFGHQGLFFVL